MEQIKIPKRGVVIGYSVDNKSLNEMSKEYNITPKEMKAVIRACGLKVRKTDEKLEEPQSTYQIYVVDGTTEIEVNN